MPLHKNIHAYHVDQHEKLKEKYLKAKWVVGSSDRCVLLSIFFASKFWLNQKVLAQAKSYGAHFEKMLFAPSSYDSSSVVVAKGVVKNFVPAPPMFPSRSPPYFIRNDSIQNLIWLMISLSFLRRSL